LLIQMILLRNMSNVMGYGLKSVGFWKYVLRELFWDLMI